MKNLKEMENMIEKLKIIEVGICHINILSDFLQILKKNDYQTLRENGYEFEFQEGFLQEWIDDLLENFCKPLIEYDKDTEIILND